MKKKTIICIIMAVLALVAITVCVLLTCNNKNEGKEITDIELKKELNRKTSIILTTGDMDVEDDTFTYNPWNLSISGLKTKDDIINYVAIRYAIATKSYKLLKAEAKDKLKNVFEIYKNDNIEFDKWFIEMDDNALDEVDFMNSYNYLFSNINNISVYLDRDFNYNVCPGATYDKDGHLFYLDYSCGGISDIYETYYIYKYTMDDDYAYTYVYFGTDNKLSSIQKYGKEALADQDTEILEQIKANPKLFNQYKLTFKKDSDGNYKFNNLELVK